MTPGYSSTCAIWVHDLCFHIVFVIWADLCVCFSVCTFVCLSRACRSSGPVSFKLPTSVNRNRNRILRPSSTFSSSTTLLVENRNTSVFPPRVSFLSLNRETKIQCCNCAHSLTPLSLLFQIKPPSR